MESKIRDYVKHHFRFDKRADIESIIEEISSNLIDRYYEQLLKMDDEQKAYVEAIKSMGDFQEKDTVSELYRVKPEWADIAFILSAVLSVSAVIMMLFSILLGFILTVGSIMLFSAGAYYYYAQAQYVRREELDIEKHNIYLTKIFSYMKTCFVFWTINLAVIFSSVITGWIVFIITARATLINPVIVTIGEHIALIIITFIIGLIIFALIAKMIYDRLLFRYRMQTGLDSPKSKIRTSIDYLSIKDKEKNGSEFALSIDKKLNVKIISFIFLLGFIIMFISPFHLYARVLHENGWYYIDGNTENTHLYFIQLIKLSFTREWGYYGIIGLIGLVQFFIVISLGIMSKIKKLSVLAISFLVWFISTIVMFIVYDTVETVGFQPNPLVFMPLLVTIFVLLIKFFVYIFLPTPSLNQEV